MVEKQHSATSIIINTGIGVGKNFRVSTVKGESRFVLMDDKFNRTTQGITSFAQHVMDEYPGHRYRAVLESTANYWLRVYDTLEGMGIETLVAHPTKTKLIAEARLKNDKVDSEILADLLRADLVYQSYATDRKHRELRQFTRARIDLVHNRTSFKEKVVAILKYELGEQEHSTFSQKGREWLSAKMGSFSWVDRMQLTSLLQIIDTMDEQVDAFASKIASVAKDDPRVRLLMTMPGVDYLTALTIMAEIADINRFPTPWKLVSYAGLSPSHKGLPGRIRQGHITKQSSR